MLHYMANSNQLSRGLQIKTLRLPDRFIDQASPQELYEDAALTALDIAEAVRSMNVRDKKMLAFTPQILS